MTGFLCIDKAEGISSARVVSEVKRITGVAHCGHMGTLDPMATGVLPVGLGRATRLFNYLLDKKKAYTAEFEFGIETDTLDSTGKVTREEKIGISEEDIRSKLGKLVGDVFQIPPKFSAKNIGGKRGYQLARAGCEFELPGKNVKVYQFKLLERLDENRFRFGIECGGGTYIRSLARDLAKELGTVGIMTALRRTKSGVFDLENSVTIEDLRIYGPDKYLIPAKDAVDYPPLTLLSADEKRLFNGLPVRAEGEGLFKVFGKEFLGIGKAEDGNLKLIAYIH